jgi:hypothetical protein
MSYSLQQKMAYTLLVIFVLGIIFCIMHILYHIIMHLLNRRQQDNEPLVI